MPPTKHKTFSKTAVKASKKPIENCAGWDPGRFNFAFAIYSRKKKLQASGCIEGLETVGSIELFRKQFLQVVKTFKPQSMCLERFHSQPGRGSKRNLELINLSIGIVIGYCMCNNIPWALVTASTHKRWLANNFKVGLMPVPAKPRKGRKPVIRKKYDITTYKEWKHLETEHEVDASNVAKWYLAMLDRDKARKEANGDNYK